ncbi:hypothetical protein KAR91_22900 [Candidatus Pacearchaeota archaeon]|nr:hypothetical protein [Candidatus Pacearchaeota archaeon]
MKHEDQKFVDIELSANLTVLPGNCSHTSIIPLGDDFGVCTKCGDKSFPITYKAACIPPNDTERLDWLSKNSCAFPMNHVTGKGFIHISTSYQDKEPFDLRTAIDEAMERND